VPSVKHLWFWPLALVVLLTDCTTKELATERLVPHVPNTVVPDVVQFTLVYNPGAAFGFSFGAFQREALIVLAVLALAMLVAMFRATRPHDTKMAASLALVVGGAAGNLLDRIRSSQGVVDFIDIGIGAQRFWTFNVADIGVTLGALVLAIHLWRTDEAIPVRASSTERRPPTEPTP
jgi:signal peptidase II